MTSLTRWFVLVTALTGACAPLSVGADFNVRTDFSGYRTFDWGPADALPTGDPRLDNNPFFNERFHEAVERNLVARGLQKATTEPPDLLVHHHVAIQQRVDTYAIDREHGYTYGESGTQVREYEQGTFIIDIAEADTKTVIWRGWAVTDVEGVIGDRERLARLIDESVTKLLAQFPPPVEGGA